LKGNNLALEVVVKAKNRKLKTSKKVAVRICWFLAIGLATAFGQEPNERSDGRVNCKLIKASGTTAVVTTDCRSPIGLCAAGFFTGDELIRGTTFASVLGASPSIGLPGIEAETSVSLAGERTITTWDGTLAFRFVTVFDTARGEFAEINRVTGGSGKFEGATGTLWLTGTGTTSFFAEVTGQICMTKR
jgi:hypothetical protein